MTPGQSKAEDRDYVLAKLGERIRVTVNTMWDDGPHYTVAEIHAAATKDAQSMLLMPVNELLQEISKTAEGVRSFVSNHYDKTVKALSDVYFDALARDFEDQHKTNLELSTHPFWKPDMWRED